MAGHAQRCGTFDVRRQAALQPRAENRKVQVRIKGLTVDVIGRAILRAVAPHLHLPTLLTTRHLQFSFRLKILFWVC